VRAGELHGERLSGGAAQRRAPRRAAAGSGEEQLISFLLDFVFLSFVVPKVLHAKTLSIFSMFVHKLFPKSFCKF
jgi:hypothetical protein